MVKKEGKQINLEIKQATIEDLEKVKELNQQLFYHDSVFDITLNLRWPSQNKDYYKRSITGKNKITFIAIVDDHIVGYLIGLIRDLEDYRLVKKVAEIENMFVLEKYRGQGIGTRLFNAFFSWAKKKGAKRKLVMAYAPNSEAISFYKKQGFSDYALTMEGNL